MTIVREQFGSGERQDIRAALEEIASPLDMWGWSSNAVYTFWDPQARDLLYVGLAVDIGERFAQHLGLKSCRASGCKREQINAWFKNHETIGYSVILQSDNMQPVVGRLAKDLGLAGPEADEVQPGELRYLEGRFIEAHRRRFGTRPPWNSVGGSRFGQAQVADLEPDALFDILPGRIDSLFVARPSIRDLAASPTAVAFEICLHTARLRAAMFGLGGSDLGDAHVLAQLVQLEEPPDESRRRLLEERWLEQPSAFLAPR